eukprot:c27894_g2_i1 orf=267-524(+)
MLYPCCLYCCYYSVLSHAPDLTFYVPVERDWYEVNLFTFQYILVDEFLDSVLISIPSSASIWKCSLHACISACTCRNCCTFTVAC